MWKAERAFGGSFWTWRRKKHVLCQVCDKILQGTWVNVWTKKRGRTGEGKGISAKVR
jgi:hypothetical protein